MTTSETFWSGKLGWEPKVAFQDGLKHTIDWYYATKNREEVKSTFGRMLTER